MAIIIIKSDKVLYSYSKMQENPWYQYIPEKTFLYLYDEISVMLLISTLFALEKKTNEVDFKIVKHE